MFQICFALSATFSDTKWFFHHVYFDRNFNCHCIEEAVYYYCILNRLPYARAQELITVINSYPEIEKPDNSNTVYTQDIINFMENCSSEEQLLHYFKENKYVFRHWNQTALRQIHAMLALIQKTFRQSHLGRFYLWKIYLRGREKTMWTCYTGIF